jgi:hypothetical protein
VKSEHDLRAIADTLLMIVTPEMTPRQLLKAARKKHPKASKKDIVRAAFYSMIAHSDAAPNKASQLQAFALSERTPVSTVDSQANDE